MMDWVLSKASSLADEVGCRFVILDSERDMVFEAVELEDLISAIKGLKTN